MTIIMSRTWIEPVVAAAQFASSFYDTGLIMVVKNYYNQTVSTTNSSSDNDLQKSISNFYIIYNLITKLTPLVPAYILAKLGDNNYREFSLCVPLTGYLVSSSILLLLILLDLPIQVMFGSAAINGLTGGFIAYWAGVMVWATLGSSENQRSIRLITNDCVFGMAGFAGSLISGHIFVNLQIGNSQGAALVSCSLANYILCLLYVIFVLRIPQLKDANIKEPSQAISENTTENLDEPIDCEYTEHSRLMDDQSNGMSAVRSMDVPVNTHASKVLIFLLFSSVSLYNASVNGTEDVINFFVLKKPLNWGPVEVGYGNAAAYMIFITSFLGVLVFSRFLGDHSLILIGMFSFGVGVLIMAFASWTYVYYIARVAMLFSLIPVPTIRSMLSKRVQETSYGKIFAILQIIMAVIAVMASSAFIKIYQATLDWFSGFSFIVIFIIVFISFILISVTFCMEK
ncbi:thymic stromal cotransporter homolog [Spea bombifrons]|uniref:thymic stromal cotransporter homolog n=1 Tax=Spea bombifrons TaxID=233779 RepID=UPI00234B494D|nr:thymic stromal cotransporter homolog [Spea bombifrons]